MSSRKQRERLREKRVAFDRQVEEIRKAKEAKKENPEEEKKTPRKSKGSTKKGKKK